jgi:uncharacterized protein with gpF-like domain
MMEDFNFKCSANPKINKDILNSMEANSKLVNQVKEEYNDVIKYEKEINKGEWIEKSNQKGVKISTRREDTTVGVLV